MQRWDDVEAFLVEEAAEDLREGLDVRPCLVAYDGSDGLFTAFLRDFPKGGYSDPIIELLALAMPLGADRLALSVSGRAWSMDDPLPPVVDGVGDLRQRVVCVTQVDGTGDVPRVISSMHPFEVRGGRVRWEPAVRSGAPEGWLTEALALAVQQRAALRASPRDMRRQARRCVRLGHLLGVSDVAARRLRLKPARVG